MGLGEGRTEFDGFTVEFDSSVVHVFFGRGVGMVVIPVLQLIFTTTIVFLALAGSLGSSSCVFADGASEL